MTPAKTLEILILGTDTGVGKTAVTVGLAQALRRRGRTVWVHKPVACGGWAEGQAEDGRRLVEACAQGQPPTSVCPFQYPEPASPHLAASSPPSLAELRANLAAVRGAHDLIVEGVGGLLVPLTATYAIIADVAAGLPALIVTRPDLGTLNHTALTVNEARRRGMHLLGLIINAARPVADSLATRTAARELAAMTTLPVLAQLRHGSQDVESLADAVLVDRAEKAGESQP